MLYLKKLLFAPLFLLSFYFCFYFLNNYLSFASSIFSYDINSITLTAYLALSIVLASIFYSLFCCLAQDWKLVMPILAIANALALIYGLNPLNTILAGGSFIALFLSFFFLDNKLKTYLDFRPTTILVPSIKTVAALLALLFSIAFYLSTNLHIQKNGFEIPDQFIDTVIKLTPLPSTNSQITQPMVNELINKSEIEKLKSNPSLLQNLGVTEKDLEAISQSISEQTPKKDVLKILDPRQIIKDQLNLAIRPYLGYLPLLLAVLFYFTLHWFVSIIALLSTPIIWLSFELLNALKVIKYVITTREVKKMVLDNEDS